MKRWLWRVPNMKKICAHHLFERNMLDVLIQTLFNFGPKTCYAIQIPDNGIILTEKQTCLIFLLMVYLHI